MADLIQKTDSLNDGRVKLNEAIQDADTAKVTAGNAVSTAGQAKQIAQTAENKADSVQTQFDQVIIEGDSSVEAAAARVDEIGAAHPTLKARVDDGFTKVTTQLADITHNQKTCQQLGLIANTDIEAVSNFAKLCGAINAGYKILVDDKYHITGNALPEIIHEDLFIEGISGNAGFMFLNTSTLFEFKGSNLKFANLDFMHIGFGQTHLIVIKNDTKINRFIAEDCGYEGNISLVAWSFTDGVYINPNSNDYGISFFSFSKNKCSNIKNTSPKHFILLSNVPLKYGCVLDNDINNFSNVFYYQSLFNDNPYLSEISTRMEYLKVDRNTVINDRDWHFDIDEGYHAFVLFEGAKCDYENNTVEGLHTVGKDIAVYDAYLSCKELNYLNNRWKNNVCFYENKSNAVLMKSKMHNLKTYKGTSRIYKGNIYEIEKSFADFFGRPYSELGADLYDFQMEIENVIVDNNTVNIYAIGMKEYQRNRSINFSNNSIRAETFYGSVFTLLSVYPEGFGSGEDLTDKEKFLFNNNTIIVEKEQNTLTRITLVQIRSTKENNKILSDIIMNGNYIALPRITTLINSTLASSNTILNKVELSNNEIVLQRITGTFNIAYGLNIRNLILKSNIDIAEIPQNSIALSPRGGFQVVNIKMEINSRLMGSERTFVLSDPDYPTELLTKKIRSRVYIKCFHSAGEENFYFDFFHFNGGGGVNSVTFTKSDNTSITRLLDGTTGSEDVKIIGNKTNLSITFRNWSNLRSFEIVGSTPIAEKCVIETRIVQSIIN
ncbi:alanine-zipper protein [Bacillus sp. FSL K6-3431]|uniref:alanine-zipper protein n=1 Tax=Bacillus sp. FSL K6-3431 TaxID=2921500 RepID=UPI0030FD07DA